MREPDGRPGTARVTTPLLVALLGVVLLAVTAGCTATPPPEPPPAGAASAWAADSLTRIGQRDTPRTGTAVELAALRGETESFQVVVSGGVSGVTGVDLTVGDLTGPAGTVPASAVTRFREHYVEVTESSPDGGGTSRPLPAGRYPDVLVPFVDPDTGAPLTGRIRAAGASAEPGRNQPYWVDVTVPADAAPGVYEGRWTVRGEDGFSTAGTVRLTVPDAALPARPALRSAFLNSSGRPSVSRELLRNRITPTSERPGPGDPLSAAITVTDAGFYSGADQYVCRLDPPPDPAEVAAVAARAAPGTLVLNYTADEIGGCPDLRAEVQAWGRALHAAGVAQLLTQTPDRALFDDGTGRPAVDIWVVLPKQYDADPAAVREAMDRGMQVWSYNALVQDGYSPKWLIDFPPIDLRIQPGFLNQSLGLTGLLYWRADNWTQDVWEDVHTYNGGYPGEGLLVYPGEEVGLPGGAVPSIRLKWLRDGVDDFDYATLARERGKSRAVAEIVSTVARSWSDWSSDPEVLLEARTELTSLITNFG